MHSLIRINLAALLFGVGSLIIASNGIAPSYAKDGENSGSSEISGSSGSGSDDSGGGSNSGSGHNDSHSGDGNDDGGSGRDEEGNSDGNSPDDGADHNSNDDQSASAARADEPSRPVAIITLTPQSLSGVQNGTLVVVDDLGRVLEVEVDRVNGAQIIKAKPHGGDARRNPGPITSITVVPAAQAPVHG